MPIATDFDAAMMQPGYSVPAVRRLGGGTLRLNDAGRPLRATGRDAVVYELQAPDGRIFALRCLLRPEAARDFGIANRYRALADDPRLRRLKVDGGPLPRDVQWIEEGVVLPGPNLQRQTAPVMAMERLPGRTLIRAVDRLAQEQQTEPLALLADRWLEAAMELERVGFSHGDLAADNLMVRPDGTIGLVDLDTAWWPSAPAASPAAGTPAYTHPRGAALDPARRDRFPALLVWASLRILARHPTLRQRWADRPDQQGAALLWTASDLRRAPRAPLFVELDALDDEILTPLLEVVRRAIRFPPEETPPLSEIAERLESLGFPRSAVLEQAPPAPRRGDGRRDEERPAPEQTNTAFAPAQQRAATPGGAPEVDAGIARERRLAAAGRLRSAIAARETATALKLWEETRGQAESALHAAAVHTLVAREATAAIERAMRRRDDDELIAAIGEAERFGVAPSAEARSAARAARQRRATRQALEDAVKRGDLASVAALARSGKLEALGRLDPTQTRAVERARAWPALERALTNGDDDAIVAAVDAAIWREEAALPLQARERVALARSRLRWVEDVRAALRRRDAPVLRGLLATTPPGAEERLSEVESRRVLRVSMREAAVARLERALREGPDQEVVAALGDLESAGTPFPEVLDWTAVRGVVDRISLAEALRAAAAADPPDAARLARLLPAARAALGDRGSADEPDWAALERHVFRAAHLARLRDALLTDDDARIAAAADPDSYGAQALLTSSELDRVVRAIAGMKERDHTVR
jgi:hypothetical protein